MNPVVQLPVSSSFADYLQIPSGLVVPEHVAESLTLESDELVVDNFAGGGGASTGIQMALGRAPDLAINHDKLALLMYAANHPSTQLLCEDIYDVVPRKVVGDRRVGLVWSSPDCTFHSNARGGKPFRDPRRARRRRGLAGVVLRWAADVRPRVLCIENVVEFEHWGPLGSDGRPDPARRGQSFRRWKARLENLGYVVAVEKLRACDYGAPTSRRRLFIWARCDGGPIDMPPVTHGPGTGRPFRTAAECLDFDRPCPSIFERKKPLAEATLRRIVAGIERFVIDAKEPFLIPVTHQGDSRVYATSEPMRTITGAHRGEQAVVAPVLARLGQQGGNGAYANEVTQPLTTITTQAEHLVVAPLLSPVKTWGGGGNDATPANVPLRTITSSKRGEHALVIPTLIQTGYGEREGQAPRVPGLDKPLGTIVATGQKHALVSTFLSTYHGEKSPGEARGAALDGQVPTLDTSNRLALVTAHIAQHYGGGPAGVQTPGLPVTAPLGTVTATDHHGVVCCHLQRDFGHSIGAPVDEPHPTIVARGGGKSAVVTSHLMKLKGTCRHGQPVTEPLHTVAAGGNHYAEVRALLQRFHPETRPARPSAQLGLPLGEPPAKDPPKERATVCIGGVLYLIVDIGLRMVEPPELFRAHSFPRDYVIDPVVLVKKNGRIKRLSKTDQVHMCGNSVPPVLSEALVRWLFRPLPAQSSPPSPSKGPAQGPPRGGLGDLLRNEHQVRGEGE